MVPLNSNPKEPPGQLRLVLLHSNNLRARRGRRYLVARHKLVHLLSQQLDYSVRRHSSSSSSNRPNRAPDFLGAPYSHSQLWVPLLVQQDRHFWVYNSRGLFSLSRSFIYSPFIGHVRAHSMRSGLFRGTRSVIDRRHQHLSRASHWACAIFEIDKVQ